MTLSPSNASERLASRGKKISNPRKGRPVRGKKKNHNEGELKTSNLSNTGLSLSTYKFLNPGVGTDVAIRGTRDESVRKGGEINP